MNNFGERSSRKFGKNGDSYNEAFWGMVFLMAPGSFFSVKLFESPID